MRTIRETPVRMIEGGHAEYGLFRTPFHAPNLMDAPGIPPCLRRWRLKEWQHWGLLHPDVYVSIALVDAKYLATAWVSVFDRRTRRVFEHARKAPFHDLGLPADVYDGGVEFNARGFRVAIRNELARGSHRIAIDIAGRSGLPAIRGEVVATQDTTQIHPLVTALPFGPGRPFYSHKVPCPVSGSLAVGAERIAFDAARDFAILDEHKAFYPRKTFWRWATFACRDGNGEVLGVNLTQNVIADDAEQNENALWHGNRLSPLGAARFDIPPSPAAPWHIRTLDGRVDLVFQPQGARSENLNLLVLASNFRQPVGLFSGTMVDDDGVRHEVKDVLGVVEDHQVTW